MNKQELVKKYEETIYAIIATEEVLKDLKQLDEPQKPVVPPFVADYIKYAIENDWDLQDLFKYIEDEDIIFNKDSEYHKQKNKEKKNPIFKRNKPKKF